MGVYINGGIWMWRGGVSEQKKKKKREKATLLLVESLMRNSK